MAERRYTMEFVKDSYKEKDITLIGGYRNLFKEVQLECELCQYTWKELFSPDKEISCPKCNSEKKVVVEKTETKKRSGRRSKLKI